MEIKLNPDLFKLKGLIPKLDPEAEPTAVTEAMKNLAEAIKG